MACAQTLVVQVARAAQEFDQRTGEPIVTYALTETFKRAFYEITEKNVGKRLELRVDGRVIFSGIVREPILGGAGQLSGQLSIEQAKEMAGLLSAGAARIEVEIKAD